MITPRITGAIITAIIIVFGIALLYPALKLETKFTANDLPAGNQSASNQQMVLLTFNIVNSSNMPNWCYEISKFLQGNKVHSAVFIAGDVADKYPTCVTRFGSDVDIGSTSYTYNNITSIPDYIAQLNAIKQGKKSIDVLAMVNSTSFRAPYGDVDENIYSQLVRSQIVADFSYRDHYNVYTNGSSGKTFYRLPLTTINNLSELQKIIPNPDIPLMINFYNYQPLRNIEESINSTSKSNYQFQSASELTKMNLTLRKE